MTIHLQNYTGDPRAIRKSASTLATLTGTLRNESNVVEPEILIDISDISLTGFNYAEIPDFGRKYFVREIQAIRNNISLIKLHVDVLGSYTDAILSLPAVLIRSQDTGAQSEYLIDSKRPILAYQVRETYEIFTFHGTAGTCILVTAG